mmetsp:Transcript_4491/g.5198  ORF Transcript_4491/g.5198 Transcript_4491/m.5198 type:complete len:302 (+) Transcript_4491:100-1005(+)|eukprot:CAMPEP_0194146064 /NCGR_PEP_ID=MMETSP0152-20130528/19467_1 /TAXON_ID=1049557 /ORGANISM="Thalassiothrix antarctica, Strain L6-D1" /LENGTH=301 /DNA_ID=CAMNT_0038846479 /DNA_START=84 /DNA_END=989 /DNA_ORIENTATION=+
MKYSVDTFISLMILTNSASSAFTSLPVAPSNTDMKHFHGHKLPLHLFFTTPSKSTTNKVFSSSRNDDSVLSLDDENDDTGTKESTAGIDLLGEVDSIFDSIDANGDGAITLEELKTHLIDEMGYTQEYTEYLFDSIDIDSNGRISKEEMRFAFYNFEALSMYMTLGMGGADITNLKAFQDLALKNIGESLAGEQAMRDKLLLGDLADLVFGIVDTDSSGIITEEELRAHFNVVTSKLTDDGSSATASQTKEYVQTMFAALDINKDGGISRDEMRTAFETYSFKLLAQTFGLRLYSDKYSTL